MVLWLHVVLKNTTICVPAVVLEGAFTVIDVVAPVGRYEALATAPFHVHSKLEAKLPEKSGKCRTTLSSWAMSMLAVKVRVRELMLFALGKPNASDVERKEPTAGTEVTGLLMTSPSEALI
jgi:hypothetical protein